MEQDTFRRILETHQQSLFVVAFGYCRNRQDAEDVLQDVFLKLFTHPPQITDDRQLHRWLIRVTINRCKDILRTPWRRLRVESAGEALPDAYEDDRTVFDAVMALPQKYREVVLLYYYEGYAVAEIAALLHRKPTTVQTQLARARAQLKTILQEE